MNRREFLNHDLIPGYDYGERLFETLYGPCWYSFDAGGAHFVVTPMPSGDAKPSYTHDQVADWMRNDLALVGGIDHSPAAVRVVAVSSKGKIGSRLCHYPRRRWQDCTASRL